MEKIILYQFESCPFCRKVREKLKSEKIIFEIVEVATDREDPLRKELYNKSGVLTVPVLQVGEKYIGDSDIIVEYINSSLK